MNITELYSNDSIQFENILLCSLIENQLLNLKSSNLELINCNKASIFLNFSLSKNKPEIDIVYERVRKLIGNWFKKEIFWGDSEQNGLGLLDLLNKSNCGVNITGGINLTEASKEDFKKHFDNFINKIPKEILDHPDFKLIIPSNFNKIIDKTVKSDFIQNEMIAGIFNNTDKSCILYNNDLDLLCSEPEKIIKIEQLDGYNDFKLNFKVNWNLVLNRPHEIFYYKHRKNNEK